jgi:hypothetical protein
MFKSKIQSNEYYETLNKFEHYCNNYSKHIEYYNKRTQYILSVLPKDTYTISYNKDKLCFEFKGIKYKQYVSEEIFDTYDLYKDDEFVSIKDRLYQLYKPALLECYYNDGNTYNSIQTNKIVSKLLKTLYNYKINYSKIAKGD